MISQIDSSALTSLNPVRRKSFFEGYRQALIDARTVGVDALQSKAQSALEALSVELRTATKKALPLAKLMDSSFSSKNKTLTRRAQVLLQARLPSLHGTTS